MSLSAPGTPARSGTSYHVHTSWSDGHAGLAAFVDEAWRLGLAEVGVSDHLTLMPDGGRPSWSMDAGEIGEYLADVRGTAVPDGLVLRAGIEADYFPETCGALERLLRPHDFDYVIGAVHVVDGFPVDTGSGRWVDLPPERQDEIWRRYWELIAGMARTGLYDIAAHLDLPKKFGFPPRDPLPAPAQDALDALAAAEMSIEINTSGWHVPAREAYPSAALLRAARERGIPLLVNADAHRPEHLVRGFARARELARSVGYEEVVRYERRRAVAVPL